MKKYFKFFSISLFVLIVGFALTTIGCENAATGGTENEVSKSPFEGVWKFSTGSIGTIRGNTLSFPSGTSRIIDWDDTYYYMSTQTTRSVYEYNIQDNGNTIYLTYIHELSRGLLGADNLILTRISY